jgi:hypothetical protein
MCKDLLRFDGVCAVVAYHNNQAHEKSPICGHGFVDWREPVGMERQQAENTAASGNRLGGPNLPHGSIFLIPVSTHYLRASTCGCRIEQLSGSGDSNYFRRTARRLGLNASVHRTL